jgi:hypothetical protein
MMDASYILKMGIWIVGIIVGLAITIAILLNWYIKKNKI